MLSMHRLVLLISRSVLFSFANSITFVSGFCLVRVWRSNNSAWSEDPEEDIDHCSLLCGRRYAYCLLPVWPEHRIKLRRLLSICHQLASFTSSMKYASERCTATVTLVKVNSYVSSSISDNT